MPPEKPPEPKTNATDKSPLSMHPLSIDEAIAGAMQADLPKNEPRRKPRPKRRKPPKEAAAASSNTPRNKPRKSKRPKKKK